MCFDLTVKEEPWETGTLIVKRSTRTHFRIDLSFVRSVFKW